MLTRRVAACCPAGVCAEARNLDKLVRLAWSGHPRLVVVDNSTAFQGKVDRVFQAVRQEAQRLGMLPPASTAAPASPASVKSSA